MRVTTHSPVIVTIFVNKAFRAKRLLQDSWRIEESLDSVEKKLRSESYVCNTPSEKLL
jgi:hypothetical protein